MSEVRGAFNKRGLIISYKALGAINIDEMMHALIADIKALKDQYNVQFVKSSRLILHVTNEYGEEISVKRPAGGTISYMDTHHYRPACKDYDLQEERSDQNG